MTVTMLVYDIRYLFKYVKESWLEWCSTRKVVPQFSKQQHNTLNKKTLNISCFFFLISKTEFLFPCVFYRLRLLPFFFF